METKIIIEAQMTEEQLEVFIFEIKRVGEIIGLPNWNHYDITTTPSHSLQLKVGSEFSSPPLKKFSRCENVWCLGGKVYINGRQNFCRDCMDKQKEN